MIIMKAMTKKVFKQLLVLILLLGGFATTYAQQLKSTDINAWKDSLVHYSETALKENPVVLQKFELYRASLERVLQSGSLPDPEFTAGIFLSPMELVMGNQLAELSLMQMFPWFGVFRYAKDEMSLMAKADYEEFKDAKLQVVYDVQRTWYEIYRLQENIRFSQKNARILQTLEKLSLSRYKSASPGSGATTIPSSGTGTMNSGTGSVSPAQGGMTMGGNTSTVSPSGSGLYSSPAQSMQQGAMGGNSSGTGLADLYRIQIETGELENSILLLENQRNTLLAKFNALLNRPPLTPVFLPDTLFADSLYTGVSYVPDSILALNPMLNMLKYEQQSFEARKEMNRRMGMPMVGIGLNYSVIGKSEMLEAEMNGRDMVMPMVKITLPVYRKKYRAMQNEAGALSSASEQEYKSVANNLISEYYEAFQLYQDAARRLKLYAKQGQLASRSLDIMIKSYSGSSVQLSDVLRVRQQVLDYQIKEVQAVTDFNISIAWLNRISGSMPLK